MTFKITAPTGHQAIEVCSVCEGRGWLAGQAYGAWELPPGSVEVTSFADFEWPNPAGRELLCVQRCDTCLRFGDDIDAAIAAAGCVSRPGAFGWVGWHGTGDSVCGVEIEGFGDVWIARDRRDGGAYEAIDDEERAERVAIAAEERRKAELDKDAHRVDAEEEAERRRRGLWRAVAAWQRATWPATGLPVCDRCGDEIAAEDPHVNDAGETYHPGCCLTCPPY